MIRSMRIGEEGCAAQTVVRAGRGLPQLPRLDVPGAWQDFKRMLAVVIALFLIASLFDVSERFSGWAEDHERWQADELPFVLLVVCGGLAWFALRRWRESRTLLVDNRALTRHLMRIQEVERMRIARDLHDEFGQQCAAIRFEAHCLRRSLETCALSAGEGRASMLGSATAIANSAETLHRNVRRLLKQLRPGALDTLGLATALSDLVGDWTSTYGVPVDWHCDELGQVADPVALALFRVAQEGLTNIAQHAGASRVSLRLSREGGILTMELSDDGHGLQTEAAPRRRGFGLVGMAERMNELGGTLSIESLPGRGVCLRVEVSAMPEVGQ